MTLVIKNMQKLAAKNGGTCLSLEYVRLRSPLIWKCKKGHIWKTSPAVIKRGSWCPVCAGNKAHTIDEMVKLAKRHRGTCVSKTYVNLEKPLKWECKRGHRWWSAPRNVLRGVWCKECNRK